MDKGRPEAGRIHCTAVTKPCKLRASKMGTDLATSCRLAEQAHFPSIESGAAGSHWELLEWLRTPRNHTGTAAQSATASGDGSTVMELLQSVATSARMFQQYGNQLGDLLCVALHLGV